ncbi:MAG: hypothetical protein KC416_16430, partial [Myxococcales bacterium]|nr:hypothetical protein [Myxococcales bacterium]
VEAVLSRSCTFENSCHGGPPGDVAANLRLDGPEGPIGALLSAGGEGVPSCEYPPMALVNPGDPDTSWLLVKLRGPIDNDGAIVAGDWGPEPGFEPGDDPDCPAFGDRMPMTGQELPAREITLIEEWIAQGAQDDRDQ